MLPVFPQTALAMPRFGAGKKLRGKRWLSGHEMADYITLRKKPYLGKPPKALMAALGVDKPGPLYKGLDQLASYIRIHNTPRHIRKLTVTLKNCKEPLELEYLGCGGWGAGYKLTVGDYQGLFKVYHYSGYPMGKLCQAKTPNEVEKRGGHGALAEIATGIYLSKWRFGDLARFYVGNPVTSWNLCELLTQDSRLEERTKRRIADMGIIKQDDKEENTTNGITNDYGDLVPAEGETIIQNFLSLPSMSRRKKLEALTKAGKDKRLAVLQNNVVDLTSAEDGFRQLPHIPEQQRAAAETLIRQFLQFDRLNELSVLER